MLRGDVSLQHRAECLQPSLAPAAQPTGQDLQPRSVPVSSTECLQLRYQNSPPTPTCTGCRRHCHSRRLSGALVLKAALNLPSLYQLNFTPVFADHSLPVVEPRGCKKKAGRSPPWIAV
jgi:hypothetical protein